MMYYLAASFEILAFITFLIVQRKNKDIVLRLLGWFLLFNVIIDIRTFVMFSYLNSSGISLSNFSLLIELFVISYVFYNLIPKQNKVTLKRVLLILFSLMFFLFVFFLLFLPLNSEWNYRFRVIASIYFVSLACYYLYREFISDNLEEYLIKKSGFWLAVGILIYHTGMSIVITLHQFTTKNSIFIKGLPLHHFFSAILSVFSSICLIIAIMVWKKRPIKSK